MRHWHLLIAACALAACSETPPETVEDDGGDPPVVDPPVVTYADPYTLTAFDATRISSDPDAANFQNIEAAIDLRDAPFASATLVIDLATTCFPFESWADNPPPAGENFPADCDAFDRLFLWHYDDIEIVHAITPFGGPLHLEIDITDIANGLPGARTLRSHITTYSDAAGMVSGSAGGWNVSARIDVTPGEAPREVLAVVPLYDEEQTDRVGPTLSFDVPQGATSGRIEYRTTGHGGGVGGIGCVGPAEGVLPPHAHGDPRRHTARGVRAVARRLRRALHARPLRRSRLRLLRRESYRRHSERAGAARQLVSRRSHAPEGVGRADDPGHARAVLGDQRGQWRRPLAHLRGVLRVRRVGLSSLRPASAQG